MDFLIQKDDYKHLNIFSLYIGHLREASKDPAKEAVQISHSE